MAFCSSNDVNLEIIKNLGGKFEFIISLMTLNKASYHFIKKTTIYEEIIKLFNNLSNAKLLSNKIKICCQCNLLNLLEMIIKLSKHTETKKCMFKFAAKFGNIKIFELFKSHIRQKFITIIIVKAAKHGNINVLEWFLNSSFDFECPKDAIDLAAAYGHINVLDWFMHTDLVFRYSSEAVNMAAKNGHIPVLNWFRDSGLKFKYNEDAMNMAVKYARIDVLDWFMSSDYEIYYENLINMAAKYARIDVLDWFMSSNYEMYYEDALNQAIMCGHMNVIQWFFNSGLDIIISVEAINKALEKGFVEIYNLFYDDDDQNSNIENNDQNEYSE